MLCRKCNSWVPETNFYCTFCGVFTGRRNNNSALFWVVELLLVVAVAAAAYHFSTSPPPHDTGDDVSLRMVGGSSVK
jgi:hypothetical protein